MHRKIMTSIYLIATVCVLLVATTAIVLAQSKFGAKAKGERLERIMKSPNFSDTKFQNEEPTELMTGNRSMIGNMWHFVFGKKPDNLIPREGEIEVVRTDLHQLPDSADLYVWFGHSSFLLRLSGLNILVDPVFYDAAPFSFINKPFPGTDVYKPADMPDVIDFLVISHDHWDHLDYRTVSELRERVRHVVCPLGVGADFEHWGYQPEQLIELDWNESVVTDSLQINCLPTRHFTGRGLGNPRTMPASWLLSIGGKRVFYTGDGGYSDRFKRYGEQFPDIDLAIMENGQYSDDWNQIHTMPHQLGLEVKELKAKQFITVHHSKFCLANHAWDEPRRNEREAADKYNLNLIVCKIGEVVRIE